MSAENYLQELSHERDSLDPSMYGHAVRLLEKEIFRVGEELGDFRRDDNELRGDYPPEVRSPYKEEIAELSDKVMLPVEEFPSFNFIGKLLGPKGSIMKSIAETTKTKIKILGRGSMKDKALEEELSKSDEAQHEHLKEALHVLVLVKCRKSEGHARLAHALEEIQNVISYQDDEHMHEQMGDMGPMPGFSRDPDDIHMGRRRGSPHPDSRYGGPPEGRMHSPPRHSPPRHSPPRRGRSPRGGGRGQRRSPPPRNAARRDSRDYGSPGPRYEQRYEDGGSEPRYDYPDDRGSYRQGDKRTVSSNGYPNKKFREDNFDDRSYPPRDNYYNAADRY